MNKILVKESTEEKNKQSQTIKSTQNINESIEINQQK